MEFKITYEIKGQRRKELVQAIENLHKIVLAKGELMAKAIGSMDLRIFENEVKVRFPWFPKTEDAEQSCPVCRYHRRCKTD